MLLLAGCGSSGTNTHSSRMPSMHMTSGPTTGTPAAGPHNTQDVSFATDMIPHHAQAVTMAEMALTKATDPNVKKLAASIKAAQAPEIASMSGWLSGWGKPVPSGSMPMHHGGMSMPGMMSDDDMASLNKATGAAFDKLWLTQMIRHHQGAIMMARTEHADGQNPDAKTLARSISASQSREISQMTHLLSTLGK
ncbi:MAG: DUF305 domain-containing protein [Mycobacteriales bacterium]